MEENNLIPEEEQPASGEDPNKVKIAKFLTEEREEVIDVPRQMSIANFWRRLAAFIIDGVIAAILFIILVSLIGDISYTLGPWGRIIGYSIIFLYLGFFNSSIGSGQTIGKAVTKIAVIDCDNKYLSLSKSFLRAFILCLIFLLNDWALSILQNPIIALIVDFIVFGGMLAMIYGLIFNKTTRQGIHDLLIGSYVVAAPPNFEAGTPQITRRQKRITFGLLGVGLLVGIVSLLFQQYPHILGFLEAEEWEEMMALQSSLMDTGEYYSVGVNRSTTRFIESSTVVTCLHIDVWVKTSCRTDPDYCEEKTEEIAQKAFDDFENIENFSGMDIKIINRFDFGLYSGSFYQGTYWGNEACVE